MWAARRARRAWLRHVTVCRSCRHDETTETYAFDMLGSLWSFRRCSACGVTLVDSGDGVVLMLIEGRTGWDRHE